MWSCLLIRCQHLGLVQDAGPQEVDQPRQLDMEVRGGERGLIVASKVPGGRLGLRPWRLPLPLLPCGGGGAAWHRLQNSHGELL